MAFENFRCTNPGLAAYVHVDKIKLLNHGYNRPDENFLGGQNLIIKK